MLTCSPTSRSITWVPLADNVSQGGAGVTNPNAPLWGWDAYLLPCTTAVAAPACAIEAHESNGGEATNVEAIFDQRLSPSQQQDILNFCARCTIDLFATTSPARHGGASPGFLFRCASPCPNMYTKFSRSVVLLGFSVSFLASASLPSKRGDLPTIGQAKCCPPRHPWLKAPVECQRFGNSSSRRCESEQEYL